MRNRSTLPSAGGKGEGRTEASKHRHLVLTFGHLHDLVTEALFAHFAEDHTMATANERTRVVRLLVHVDRHVSGCPLCGALNVDSEYSRVGAGLANKELRGQRVFPDVLLHSRTVQTGNVLAAEVKLRESSRPRRGPDRDDRIKIDAMTGCDHGLPNGIAPYSVGLCLNLAGNSAEGWWTVPQVGLWCERETFGVGPSPMLMDAFDLVVWATGA